MKLSEKIYENRKRLGLSQEMFAERMGVSRQAVSKWETGEATPDLTKIPTMAKLFGISTDALLMDEFSEEPSAPLEEEPMATEEEEGAPEAPPPSIHRHDYVVGIVLAAIGLGIALFGTVVLIIMNTLFGSPFIEEGLVPGFPHEYEIGESIDPETKPLEYDHDADASE